MPEPAADLRIEARWILPMTARDQVLEEHAAIVRDGRIADILPVAEARRRYAATLVVERPMHLLMPGFVNAHSRAARHGAPDGAASGVATPGGATSGVATPGGAAASAPAAYAGRVEDYICAGIGAMLRGGVTCFGDASLVPAQTARAAAELGMRAVIGMPVTDSANLWARNAADALTKALSALDEYKGHPSVSIAFAPQAPNALSDSSFARIATLADELDVGVFMPVHASADEIRESLARHGLRPIERLDRLGLLTPALTAIHMVHADAADIALAQRAGIAVTLCPESNLANRNGPAPVAALAQAGLRLALGSDGAASHDDQDLWTEIKLLGFHAGAGSGPWEALAMATRGGAAALGLDAEVGTLERGKWADFCCIDLGGPATPPPHDPLAQLVFCGGRDMVTDVWVAGRQLLADSRLTRLDWPALRARLASHPFDRPP
jgi:5-methylthioadenosine/S-adenosylhomocysteine deaminase